ncbi:hypothetical protein K450DRAFT_279932 [Umbelopsis ramanniana AG]|uniref:RNA polymerase II-associated protein 1 n=1 Tax=Umbelopsis ramanniana AG TaxID=1314678 RepID=A0AAD5EAM7_UMBRA|nr:uncharacterized protein K450DRAFT_279932 [Umbelopsis ramanniana AG]KAI8580468.1 hypothetical protein K450DRAFT_279932 [Umbelopsis ramanniana AG]
MENSIRPRLEDIEDEEDLLRLQEEFISMNSTPAAKVIRRPPPVFGSAPTPAKIEEEEDLGMPDLEDVPELEAVPEKRPDRKMKSGKKKSLFASRRAQASNTAESAPKQEEEPLVTKRLIDVNSMLGNVIGTVKESIPEPKKDVVKLDFDLGFANRARQSTGFPQPVHRSEFRKRMDEKLNKEKDQATILSDLPSKDDEEFVNEKYQDIHEENTNAINAMSEEDIIAARAQLMASMDPALIEKLMKRKPMSERKEDTPSASPNVKKVQFSDTIDTAADVMEEDHPIAMKKKYFQNVESEPEKMIWMGIGEQQDQTTDVPSFSNAAAQLRFDFAGNIITDKSVPVHKGLHHHGQNPNEAGYTIPELFHLMRSQVSSQRVIVLNTISRIIQKTKQQGYGRSISGNIWSFIISDMKGATYLRAALDDKYTGAVAAAINALASLICNDDDDISMYKHLRFNLDRGYERIWQIPAGEVDSATSASGLDKKFTNAVDTLNNTSADDDTEEPEANTMEAHAKLAEKDVISALVQMNILPRIRYLLEHMCQPGGLDSWTVMRLISITERLARTSDSICEMIAVEEPKIVDLIVSHGIENTQWPIISSSQSSNKSNVGWPSLEAIHFLHAMAAAKKQIAISVCIETGHVDNTLRFLTLSPSAMSDPSAVIHAFELQLATLELYRLLAAYGLYCHVMADLAPKIPLWIMAKDTLDNEKWDKAAELTYARSISVIALLETYLHDASDTHRTLPQHDICWAQPMAFHELIVSILKKSAADLVSISTKKDTDLQDDAQLSLIAVSIGYLATWCRYLDSNPPADKQIVEDTWVAIADSLLQSSWLSALERLLDHLGQSWPSRPQPVQYTNLSGIYGPDTLDHYKCLSKRDIVLDVVARFSQLLGSYGRIPLANIAQQACEWLIHDQVAHIMIDQIAKLYLGAHHTSFSWMESRHTRKYPAQTVWSHLYSVTSLTLSTRALPKSTIEPMSILAGFFMHKSSSGDEWPVQWILNHVLSTSSTTEKESNDDGVLLPFYKECIGSDAKLQESKGLFLHDGRFIETMVQSGIQDTKIPHNVLALLLSPIDELYHADKSEILRDLPHGYNATEPNIVTAALDKTLQIYKLFSGHQDLTTVAVSLMKLFLLGERSGRNVQVEVGFGHPEDGQDLFRDSNVTLRIQEWLNCMSAAQLHASLQEAWSDSSCHVRKAAVPFYQFYQDFAAQYAAISYGDRSFARLLLLPLMSSCPIDYKHHLWNDLIDTLPTIRVPITDLLGGVQAYVQPPEQNESILRDMLLAVCTRKVSKVDMNGGENGALYWLALHHLRFAYSNHTTPPSLLRDLQVLQPLFDQPFPSELANTSI